MGHWAISRRSVQTLSLLILPTGRRPILAGLGSYPGLEVRKAGFLQMHQRPRNTARKIVNLLVLGQRATPKDGKESRVWKGKDAPTIAPSIQVAWGQAEGRRGGQVKLRFTPTAKCLGM